MRYVLLSIQLISNALYPTISHIIKDLFGLDIPLPFATFGVFMVLAFIAASPVLKSELKRKEQLRLIKPALNKKGRRIIPHMQVGNILLITAVSGILGARVFSILENPKELIADPMETLFSSSGLTFYGGLIFAIIAIWVYAKKIKLSITHLADAAAPALLLAYGVGRLGCHLSGDGDWGIDNLSPKPSWMNFLPDWMWAYNYPNNVIGAGVSYSGTDGEYCTVLVNPVFPTPFYEFLFGILFFTIFWLIRKRITIPGLMFFIYLTVSGLERYLIEQIRIDSEYNIGRYYIKQAEIIAFISIFVGAFAVSYILVRKNDFYKNINSNKR